MTGRREALLVALLTAAILSSLGQTLKGYVIERRRLVETEISTRRTRRLIAEVPAMRRVIQAAGASDTLPTPLLHATRRAAAFTELASAVLAEVPEFQTDVPQLVAVDDTTRIAGLRKGRVRVRMTGSSADLVEFLERILTGSTLLRIDELRLEVIGQGATTSTEALLSMELVASAWYREGA